MNKKQEIYTDITQNCDTILDLLKDYSTTNETVEGRMIYQCCWLKEQVAANALPLPVLDYVHTLNHVCTENLLRPIASVPEQYDHEVGIYLYRLMSLTEAKLLLKSLYHPYTIRYIEALLNLLRTASRPLDQYEQGLIRELMQLKQLLSASKIDPPLMYYLPDYLNFRKVYRISKSSVDDLPNGKFLTKTVANLLFEGVRPDSWLTPEDADRETALL